MFSLLIEGLISFATLLFQVGVTGVYLLTVAIILIAGRRLYKYVVVATVVLSAFSDLYVQMPVAGFFLLYAVLAMTVFCHWAVRPRVSYKIGGVQGTTRH